MNRVDSAMIINVVLVIAAILVIPLLHVGMLDAMFGRKSFVNRGQIYGSGVVLAMVVAAFYVAFQFRQAANQKQKSGMSNVMFDKVNAAVAERME